MKSQPRCFDHRNTDTRPRSCTVCNRIGVETNIVIRITKWLLANGYSLSTDDTESARPPEPTDNLQTISAELMETDEEWLEVFDNKKTYIGHIRLIYGNDTGWDVINDYSVALENTLQPILNWIDRYEDENESLNT